MTDTAPRIRVALAGVTGWAGAPLARGIVAAPDLQLVAGIARRAAGKSVGDALGIDCAAPVVATAAEALAQGVDVFFEYSKPDIAIVSVLAALQAGARVVVGTSGLSDEEYARIDAAGRGVLACGNFAAPGGAAGLETAFRDDAGASAAREGLRPCASTR